MRGDAAGMIGERGRSGQWAVVAGLPSGNLDVGPAVADAAAQSDLGQHRATYRSAEPSARRAVIEAVGVVLFAVVTVIGFAIGAEILGILGLTIVLMVGGRLLFDLLWLGYVSSRNRHARLDLYEHGVVVIVEGTPRAIRYDTTTLKRNVVQLVRSPKPEQISHAYTLTDAIGDPIVLRHTIAQPATWGPAIDRAVTAAQLPRSIAMLDAGGRLDFEHFWMTSTRIGAGNRSAAWLQVTEVEVSKGWVSIYVTGQSGPLESLPVSLIPNFTVFLKLVERMRTEYGASS
ncbi:DUF6585 family protein [Nocardia sp. Root136]|uniref:DUF6585 family protein n=1 Tax=Nocardia sp. Root136 TaxID=1736458 RepID=UPI0012E72CEB|nr:DUF6585 family protein [Nocardia sp. Root136]